MKFKKLVLVSIILLAILTLGSVSASDYDDGLAVDDSGDDLEISSLDSNIIYENEGDLVADESSDSSDSADSSDLILKEDGNSKALSNSALSDENSTILDENSTVIKSPTILEVSAEDIYYGDDCIVSISLKDEMNRPIDGTVALILDGVDHQIDIHDGIGEFIINDLNAGTYVLNALYLGDENYMGSNASATFEVLEEEQDDESPLYINEGLISFREVVGLDIGNSTSGFLLVMDADTNEVLFSKSIANMDYNYYMKGYKFDQYNGFYVFKEDLNLTTGSYNLVANYIDVENNDSIEARGRVFVDYDSYLCADEVDINDDDAVLLRVHIFDDFDEGVLEICYDVDSEEREDDWAVIKNVTITEDLLGTNLDFKMSDLGITTDNSYVIYVNFIPNNFTSEYDEETDEETYYWNGEEISHELAHYIAYWKYHTIESSYLDIVDNSKFRMRMNATSILDANGKLFVYGPKNAENESFKLTVTNLDDSTVVKTLDRFVISGGTYMNFSLDEMNIQSPGTYAFDLYDANGVKLADTFKFTFADPFDIRNTVNPNFEDWQRVIIGTNDFDKSTVVYLVIPWTVENGTVRITDEGGAVLYNEPLSNIKYLSEKEQIDYQFYGEESTLDNLKRYYILDSDLDGSFPAGNYTFYAYFDGAKSFNSTVERRFVERKMISSDGVTIELFNYNEHDLNDEEDRIATVLAEYFNQDGSEFIPSVDNAVEVVLKDEEGIEQTFYFYGEEDEEIEGAVYYSINLFDKEVEPGDYDVTVRYYLNGDNAVSISANMTFIRDEEEDEIIVNPDNFFEFFNEDGVLTADEGRLVFEGEFTGEGLGISSITINNPVELVGGEESSFEGISFIIHSDYVHIQDMQISYTDAQNGDSFAILVEESNDVCIENSVVEYIGLTDGTYINNAMRVRDSSNVSIKNNLFRVTLPSADVTYDDIYWTANFYSEGIVFYGSNEFEFIDNTLIVDFVDIDASYGTIYALSVRGTDYEFDDDSEIIYTNLSSDYIISGNHIRISGDDYAYGIYASGDEFLISENYINASSNNYAYGINAEGPCSGEIIANEIAVESTTSAYAIYVVPGYGPTSVNFINNKIYGKSYFAVGIYDDAEIINGNEITLEANYGVGIAVFSEADVSDNNIFIDASNTGDEQIWESLPIETAGVVVKKDASITNNKVESTGKSVSVIGGSSEISHNDLTGPVSIESDGNSLFNNKISAEEAEYAVSVNGSANNVNYNEIHSQNAEGDSAVNSEGEDNVVEDNNDGTQKHTEGDVTIEIFRDDFDIAAGDVDIVHVTVPSDYGGTIEISIGDEMFMSMDLDEFIDFVVADGMTRYSIHPDNLDGIKPGSHIITVRYFDDVNDVSYDGYINLIESPEEDSSINIDTDVNPTVDVTTNEDIEGTLVISMDEEILYEADLKEISLYDDEDELYHHYVTPENYANNLYPDEYTITVAYYDDEGGLIETRDFDIRIEEEDENDFDWEIYRWNDPNEPNEALSIWPRDHISGGSIEITVEDENGETWTSLRYLDDDYDGSWLTADLLIGDYGRYLLSAKYISDDDEETIIFEDEEFFATNIQVRHEWEIYLNDPMFIIAIYNAGDDTEVTIGDSYPIEGSRMPNGGPLVWYVPAEVYLSGEYDVSIALYDEEGNFFANYDYILTVKDIDYNNYTLIHNLDWDYFTSDTTVAALYCPIGSEGPLTIEIYGPGDDDDYRSHGLIKTITDEISPDDEGYFKEWTLADLGINEPGWNYGFVINVGDGEFEGEFGFGAMMYHGIFIDIHEESSLDDDWLVDIYSPLDNDGEVILMIGDEVYFNDTLQNLKIYQSEDDIENYAAHFHFGPANFNKTIEAGEYENVVVYYIGDDGYETSSDKLDNPDIIYIEGVDYTNLELTVGDDPSIVTAKLTDSAGDALSDVIYVSVNGGEEVEYTTNDDGIAYIEVDGNVTVSAYYKNTEGGWYGDEINVYVFNVPEEIIIRPNATIALEKLGNTVLITLSDDDGNPIVDAELSVYVNDVETLVDATDDLGMTSVDVEGNATVYVVYIDDNGIEVSSSIVIENTSETVAVVANGIFTVYIHDEDILVYLDDEEGEPIEGATINIRIDDEDVEPQVTDETGGITIPIGSDTIVELSYTDENGATVSYTVQVSRDIIMYAVEFILTPLDESSFEVYVSVDGEGIPGASITYYIDDDEDGITVDLDDDSTAIVPYNNTKNQTITIEYVDEDYNYFYSVYEVVVFNNTEIVPVEVYIRPNATIALEKLGNTVLITLSDLDGNPISDAKLNVYVDNMETVVNKTDAQGKSSLVVEGNATVLVIYIDDNLIPVSSSIVIINETQIEEVKVPVVANASVDVVTSDDAITVTIKDLDGVPIANATVVAVIDGKEQNMTADKDGVISILVEGNVTVELKYTDANGASVSAGVKVVESIKEIEVPVEVPAPVANATLALETKDGSSVTVTLKDLDGKAIPNAPISAIVNGAEMNMTVDKDGKAVIPLKGNSTVEVKYKDPLNNATADSSMSVTVIENVVEKIIEVIPNRTATVIEYKDMNTTSVVVGVDGRIGENFNATLKDINGKPLVNKTVQIGFNGKTYERITDSKGHVELQINLKAAGRYTFALAFLGDEYYNGTFEVALITVEVQKGKLTTASKTYKASAKTKQLSATFKSAKGNAIPGIKVTFTVNGKTYTAKTNSKGVATVNVSLNKKGTYSFTAKTTATDAYASISAKGKLTIK